MDTRPQQWGGSGPRMEKAESALVNPLADTDSPEQVPGTQSTPQGSCPPAGLLSITNWVKGGYFETNGTGQ